MAATKTGATWFTNTAVTAGSSSTTTSLDLTQKYGASIYFNIKNGATAPSNAAYVEIQASPNDTNWFRWGSWVAGSPDNAGTISMGGIHVDDTVNYIRLLLVGGSDQSVNFDGYYVTVDSL